MAIHCIHTDYYKILQNAISYARKQEEKNHKLMQIELEKAANQHSFSWEILCHPNYFHH